MLTAHHMPDFKEFYKAITRERAPLIMVLDVIFLLTPGLVTVFYFNKGLFISLDWIKLLFLALTITSPLALANSILFDLAYGNKNREIKNDDLFWDFSISTVVSGLLIYGLVAVSYLLNIQFKTDLWIIILIECGLLIIGEYRERKQKKIIAQKNPAEAER